MSDKNEGTYCNSPTAKEMLLPLHVEPSADPVSGGDTPIKRPTLSPVLLSPGSTTQKLIASGKIKNCIILLQKTNLDHNSLAKFADKGGSALGDETVTGQTELTDTDAESAVGNHECYKETEWKATNLPEIELETTNLPDHGIREEEPDTTKCDRSAVNRNIFTSFLNEFLTRRQLNYNTSDSPQMDSTPRTILAEETNPVTSTNTLDQLTDLDRREGGQFQSDDLMSISSTGSSDTIEYPKCDEEDASERSDIIDNEEYDDDELEIQAATNTENGTEELGDEPPRLERLESLAEPHYSFDNSLLSPPLLTSIRDDTERERCRFNVSLSLQGKEVSPNAPSNGDAHGVDIEPAESPVVSSACSTEIPENQPPSIPAQTEPSGRSQSGLTSTAHDALLLRSSSGTTGYIEKNENQSLMSDHDHRRQIDLTNVINDVFLSHSSSIPVNTTLSNVGTSRRTSRDWIPQRDQCVDAEIQETLQQIVNTSKDTAEYETNASQEVMYSADSPLADSAVSIQIAEVVSLSENTPIAGQELPEGPEEPVRNIVPDGPVFIGVAEEQVGSMASQPDPSTYSCSQCVDVDPNNSVVDGGEFSAVATSVHSSLSDINSETEIERAVASISDIRQLEADRAQDICENIFDGNIQVAEVIIDTHADDSESSANGVGIMFSLDRRTSTNEEKGRVRSRDEISNDKTGDQRDDQTKDNDAQNIVLAIQSPSASSKDNTPPLTEKGQEDVVSKFSSAFEVGRNSNENSPVVPSADFWTPEQCPGDKETQTGNQKDEFPVAESETETESACLDDEEKIHEVSDSVATEPRVLESQICGEEVCGSQKVTDSSTRGGALSQTSQEISQSKQLSFEIHDHGSRVPIRNDESIAIGTGKEMGTDAVETISLLQDVATSTPERNTHEAGSETSFNRGADDASTFAPSRSQEMDTAISLALMSEMTEAQQQRSAGDQLSSSHTPQTTTLSSLTPAVYQDNGMPADMRIRHLSASQIPNSSHGEGNSASNAYTSLRPNSAHGVATQNGAISTEAQVGSQQATVRGSRGRPRGRGSSGFAIVDYSNSVPPQAGNFEELKWRLVQDRRLHPNPEQQVNVSQQAASPYLPPWAVTGSQRELKAPRGKGRHEVVSMQTGVPIEFPDGKRFIAYNKEALNYQPMNFLKRQAGWQTKAQTHSFRVPNEDNSGTSQFRGAVQAVTPQVPQNAPQHFQLSQSTLAPGMEVHNANQHTAGAVNTHPRPPFPSASQMLQNLQSPRTASGVFIGEYPTHWQQPQVSSAHQGPSLPAAHVNDAPSHLPQRITHAPDQANAVNSLGLGLGTHSYQESIRAAHGLQGGYDRTGLLNTRRAVQPPGNVLQTAPDESGQVLVQNEQIGPAGGRGQTSKAVAATDSFRQSTNRHSTTQLRSGCADGATAKRQATAANGQDLEYPMDSYVAQQQLFLRARGFDVASNERTAEHEVDKTTPAYRQHKDVSQEHTPRDTEQQYLTTSNITSVQSAEMRTVTPTNNFPRNVLLSGRNLAARPEQNEKSATASALVDRRDVVCPAVSASLYIANQADASTQRAINPDVYQNRELAPQVQSIHVGAGSYQTATSGVTGNAENHLHRGHLLRDFNRNASHRPAGQVPASVDYLSAKTPFEMKAPGPGSRQDHAPMKDIPTSDEWDVAKEQALLKSLPPELANYVIGQRREGTPIAEALKAILTSLLEEESRETRRAREQEAQGQKQRVWRSTIHYRSSEAEPHNGTVTNVTSQDGIYPIPLRHPTQTADVLAEDCRSFPRENPTSQPQYGQTLGLSAGVGNSDGNQRLDCLTQNPKNGSTTRFYNPPPLVRPLYKADIPLDTRTVEPQRDTLYSPENSDSAIDLRTQRIAATTSIDHCGAVYSEEHPIDTQYLIPNNSLYHRAYTAGELGPIRASSLINLSTQIMPPLATPFMQQNLSSTQLLIRNKLLERRSRLQSLSISTPDIVHGYSYPVKRKRKNVLKPSAQTDKTLHTANPAPSTFQVNEDTRPNVDEISLRSITAPYPTVQAVSIAGGNAQRQMYCKDVVSDHTTYNSQEAESDTLVQYPKLKSDLQSRWVTESVQPQARTNNAHIQQADNLQTRGTTIADPPRGEGGNVPSTPEQTGTSNLTKSTISHSSHQANYFSSDPSTVTTSDLHTEKIPDTAVQPLAMSGERSGRPKGSKPPGKRRTGETSTGYNFQCQFCEFKSCFLSDIRSHVKQAHFDKYRKNGAPKRSKSEKSRADADKMPYIDFASSVAASGIATKNQTTVMSDVQNNLNNELTVSSKGQKGGSDSSQMTNSVTKTTSSVVVVSSVVAPQQVMTAHAPHDERLTGETQAAESVSLASHPTVTGNSTAKTSPDGGQHAEEQQLHCSHCNLPCKDAKELHIHVKFQHTNIKGLPLCFNCGYTAKSNYGLRKHILKWHAQSKGDKYKCTHADCNESFVTEEELQRHLRSHNTKKNYSCDLCDAKYQYLTGLKYHQVRHRLSYPHECKQCGLKFKSVGMLNRHEFQRKHFSS